MVSENDLDYAGFKALFEDFYEEVRKAVESFNNARLENAELTKEYVLRISELVMQRLHATLLRQSLFHNSKDYLYAEKSEALAWVQPEHVNLPEAKFTTNYAMWGVSAQLLRSIESCRTPLSMQRCLDGAIKAVC